VGKKVVLTCFEGLSSICLEGLEKENSRNIGLLDILQA